MSGPAPPKAETPAWAVKAILWRGEDITERFLDFEPNQVIEGLEIVFSRRWSELTGVVTNDQGQPPEEAWLVLFPAEESRWTPDSRRLRLSRTGPDGTYRLQRLVTGDYLLAVVPAMEPGQWQDPDFLKTLVDRATRVSVVDGEKATLNLRVQ